MTFPRARLYLTIAVIPFAARCAARESAPERALTSISDIRSLSETEAARAYPAHLQATVLIYDYRGKPGSLVHELLLHDGKDGIFVYYAGEPLDLQTGEKIDLRGRTGRGLFAPIVKSEALSRLGRASLPAARPVTLKDVLSGREDCQWVEIEGVVRRSFVAEDRLEMTLDVDGTRVPVSFAGAARAWPASGDQVEARVAVRGVVTGVFNAQAQMTSVRSIYSPNPDYIRVLRAPHGDAFGRPLRAFDKLAPALHGAANDERVKVSGVVTHHWPGHAVFLSDGKRGLMLKRAGGEQAAIGDTVEAVGFREAGKYSAFLQDSTVRRTGAGALPKVRRVDAAAALSGAHDGSLVSFRAQFIDRSREGDEEVFLLSAGGTPFTARLLSSATGSASSVNGALRSGDAVQITGICTGEDIPSEFGKRGWQMGPIQMLLRSPADLSVISWWTSEKLLTLLGAMLTVLALSLLWVGALRRRVRAQTAIIREQVRQTAELDERNRIARELHDTLAQGFAGTAFALEGIATNLEAGEQRLRPQIDMALRMVRHSLTEARRSVMNLRADALENRELASALEEAARNLAAGHTAELRTGIRPLSAPLQPDVENNIFRIGVEAITNTLRHASPHVIEVQMLEEDAEIVLRVRDDGAGFDPTNAPRSGHFGVMGMRERARQIGAALSIESAPGAGCEVRLVLTRPLAAERKLGSESKRRPFQQ